jgi:hypothetical protein
MQALSPRLRALSIGLSVAILIAMAGPAAARENAQIKRIKKTLVGIESVISGAEAEREPLGPETWTLERKIGVLQRQIQSGRVTGATPDVGVFVELIELQAGRRAALARMVELDALIEALQNKRTEVIASLQEVVQERVASHAIKEAVASWSSQGTLITYSADWEAVALCESSGRWKIDARFDGGLQFDPPTWIGFGGAEFARYAFDATKKEQITIAERVLAIQGPKAWPNCFTPLSTL